ncbi:hypothetical protein CDAR_417071 [Caerostris darwini]|uniref:Uncharacterized protein n=1 Tax=Caerostris darwini TaxID=1538125 RepID=A0AAV4X8P7_9ARAC|nr:hypothetical protein CDAR_417071 [Caerostris darwini]
MSLMQVSLICIIGDKHTHSIWSARGQGVPPLGERLYRPPDQVKCGAELANLGLSPPRQNMLLRQHSELRGRDFAASDGGGRGHIT